MEYNSTWSGVSAAVKITTRCSNRNFLCRYTPSYQPPSVTEGLEPYYVEKNYDEDYPPVTENITVPKPFQRPMLIFNFTFASLMIPPCHSKDEGKSFPDPFNCRRYSTCLRGNLYVFLCPQIMSYDHKRQKCGHKEFSICAKNALAVDFPNWRKTLTWYYKKNRSEELKKKIVKDVTPARKMYKENYREGFGDLIGDNRALKGPNSCNVFILIALLFLFFLHSLYSLSS